jgi:hypothetical protein
MNELKYARLLNILREGKYRIKLEEGEIISYGKHFLGGQIGSVDYKTGYRIVTLKLQDRYIRYYEHEVIATQAGYDIENARIEHIDGNIQNNSIHNLRIIPTRKCF